MGFFVFKKNLKVKAQTEDALKKVVYFSAHPACGEKIFCAHTANSVVFKNFILCR
jgi:hypothetical protein